MDSIDRCILSEGMEDTGWAERGDGVTARILSSSLSISHERAASVLVALIPLQALWGDR